MSLQLSNYTQWVEAGERIDYVEVRLGEQYNIPFTIQSTATSTSPAQIIDITDWVFVVNSEVYSATCTYNGLGQMVQIADIQPQLPVSTPAGLQIVDIVGPNGTGVLQVPSSVNPDPNRLIFPDTANTMMNLITITCTYPSSSVGFNNIRKIMFGLLVRLG
jgi:hypothetical protein